MTSGGKIFFIAGGEQSLYRDLGWIVSQIHYIVGEEQSVYADSGPRLGLDCVTNNFLIWPRNIFIVGGERWVLSLTPPPQKN
jgi:hypothetical protein